MVDDIVKTATADGGLLKFTDNHRPLMPSGDFEIRVSQSVQAQGRPTTADKNPPPPSISENFAGKKRYFSVAGPRFAITPDLIHAQFPPQGSLGDYKNVLPHISFTRSTLAWERFANLPNPDHVEGAEQEVTDAMLKTPWMALLLFDQDELPEPSEDRVTGQHAPVEATKTRISDVKKLVLEEDSNRARWMLCPEPTNGTERAEFSHEISQQANDPVSVIDVPSALLRTILPSPRDTELLAHVRGAVDAQGHSNGPEVGTLICNRLPRKGVKSVMHLVSLEAHYQGSGGTIWEAMNKTNVVQLVTLASWSFSCLDPKESFKGLLHHLNKQHLFSLPITSAEIAPFGYPSSALMQAFEDNGRPLEEDAKCVAAPTEWVIHDIEHHLRLTVRQAFDGRYKVFQNEQFLADLAFEKGQENPDLQTILAVVRNTHFKNFPHLRLHEGYSWINVNPAERWRVTQSKGPGYWVHANGSDYEIHIALPHTLRLNSEHLDVAREKVEQGHLAVAHQTRQGNNTVSWYRGPLATGGQAASERGKALAPETPRSADHLVRYNPAEGMLTMTYAAAWQLGQMLTLQNQKVATSLLSWKRQHRLATERSRAEADLTHLPIMGRKMPSADMIGATLPDDVQKWFTDIALLYGLPQNYVIPDETMLPAESLRFFQVDPQWIRSLQDGAFSVGRSTPMDHEREKGHDLHHRTAPSGIVSGVLLRSELVSGWPDLQIDAYDEAVQHENYEAPLRPAPYPILEFPRDGSGLQDALETSNVPIVAARFNLNLDDDIAISTVIPHARWLININKNKALYRVQKTNTGFQLNLENKLPLLRMSHLTPNVLLCLFAGDLKSVDIHQRPQALHFGFSQSPLEGDEIRYYREMKSHMGTELPGFEIDMPHLNDARKDRRVLDVTGLVSELQGSFCNLSDERLLKIATNAMGEDEEAIATFSSAFKRSGTLTFRSSQLALQLTEGAEKVRFVLG